mmetsp:Transcript_6227/g.18556  ORF Transcript_6227/g.18556 Transcript_6227/m.18556 type:complete len:201 (-) Transcript_6227:337-939(-)
MGEPGPAGDAAGSSLTADLERSAELRKQVEELLDSAAVRIPVVPRMQSADRRVEATADAMKAVLPAHDVHAAREERAAMLTRQREDLVRQAESLRAQHEAIDLNHAIHEAQRVSSIAADRSRREGDILADRALRKISNLQDEFKDKMRADGVDINAELADLGVTGTDMDALRKQGAEKNKYTTTMDSARREHKQKRGTGA